MKEQKILFDDEGPDVGAPGQGLHQPKQSSYFRPAVTQN